MLKRPPVINTETVKLRSLVSEAHVASNGSAVAGTISNSYKPGFKAEQIPSKKAYETLGLVNFQQPKGFTRTH